jgi:hypothetical protein
MSQRNPKRLHSPRDPTTQRLFERSSSQTCPLGRIQRSCGKKLARFLVQRKWYIRSPIMMNILVRWGLFSCTFLSKLIFESLALVKFSSPAQASAAVSKLHNHVFKGSRLSATIKKRADKLVTGRKSGAPSRSSRLIIRNLPWHVSSRPTFDKLDTNNVIHYLDHRRRPACTLRSLRSHLFYHSPRCSIRRVRI